MPNQKTMWTRCLGGISVMWVTKLLISQVKKRIFCPKSTKFGPKLAFLVDLGQAMQAYSMPCCGSVGGCGARAVSRKTPIYFILYYKMPEKCYCWLGPIVRSVSYMYENGWKKCYYRGGVGRQIIFCVYPPHLLSLLRPQVFDVDRPPLFKSIW